MTKSRSFLIWTFWQRHGLVSAPRRQKEVPEPVWLPELGCNPSRSFWTSLFPPDPPCSITTCRKFRMDHLKPWWKWASIPGLQINVTRTPGRTKKKKKKKVGKQRGNEKGRRVVREMGRPCFKITQQDEPHLVFISTSTRCKAVREQSPLADGVEYGTLSRINETKYSNYRLILLPSVSRQVFVSIVQATNYPHAREGMASEQTPWLLLRKKKKTEQLIWFPLEDVCPGKRGDWSSLSFPTRTGCIGWGYPRHSHW